MGKVYTEMKTLRRIFKNSRHQKHCHRNGEHLWWLISRLDMAKEKIAEIEDILIEISKTEKQVEKKGTYPLPHKNPE